jgi:hypothetical protein
MSELRDLAALAAYAWELSSNPAVVRTRASHGNNSFF